ncbi:MAG: hypothetical protein KGM44_04690, partial [bacterium]|nr:hypothetical protein [bacterium]
MLNRLLAELIDDAGLYPPARLPMDRALRNHDATNAGIYQWMVGRFIVPASRLDELLAELHGVKTRPLALGVVLDGASADSVRGGVGKAHEALRRMPDALCVELFELPLAGAQTEAGARASLLEALDAVARSFDERTALYAELPPAHAEPGLAAVAGTRAQAAGAGGTRT